MANPVNTPLQHHGSQTFPSPTNRRATINATDEKINWIAVGLITTGIFLTTFALFAAASATVSVFASLGIVPFTACVLTTAGFSAGAIPCFIFGGKKL